MENEKTFFPSSHKEKVENYPYGYTLKTDKFYSLEFREMKGFRLVTQTINPKTGLLNKPKKSTYSPLMLLVNVGGKIKAHVERFYDDGGKDRGYKFMFDNFNNFTQEEIKGVALYNLMLLKADIQAKCTYCNSDHKKMLPLYNKAIKTLVKIANEGLNLWNEAVIDWKAVEALEEKGYNPFKVTTHEPIKLSSL